MAYLPLSKELKIMRELSDIKNKELFAIVSVGYNRLKSQKRLLHSLLNADYSGYSDVPLVISIDCSGDEELYDYARKFEWPYGEKYVLIREKRMGLKEHILACGDLTQYFKGIILLEDDIYVAKGFYDYTMQTNNYYGDCPKVSSIALYANEMNGFLWLPMVKLKNESDVTAGQSVATWGEAWNSRMWAEFRDWLAKTEIPWDDLDMPHQIKEWTKAWSKYYDAYMVMEDKYSIYPYTSLTTNFSDAGEHGSANNTIVQVSLQQGKKQYNFMPFGQLVKYDIYSNNLLLPEVLGIPRKDICLDLYGVRPNDKNCRYYLSVKRLPYKVVKSYGLFMRPQELNVIEGVPGNDIFLYDTSEKGNKPKGGSKAGRIIYYLHGFNYKYLPLATWANCIILSKKVMDRLKKYSKKLFK